LPPHHDLCSIGVYTHGLESTAATGKDLETTLQAFAGLG
jgi:hypothetical protein